ncbi:hypothetical protein [Sphaerisporangium sp. TRM90804]|uniref:hypothetical protein n=1 Tax=Sphaerisporangium sp. TRM90804 TaxID=3031113 RepID=UPI00244A8658|nr:hypothetical protein [Sphaerisporangium sp. TRM90804]MDH2428159.1 hypothetical protein [Sphaerisporangium sp. TRM90804]
MRGVRGQAEVALPGLLVGVVAGAMAGGLTLAAGQPARWAAISALTLAVPLGLLGLGYGLLLARGVFQPGLFAPAGLYWLAGFPVARLVQETATSTLIFGSASLREDVLGFVAYQAIVSLGFAIGFVWTHERVAPYWFVRAARHNPLAAQVLDRYVAHAEVLSRSRRRRRTLRQGERGA